MLNIFIWGTGIYGEEAIQYILDRENEYNLVGVYDSSKQKVGQMFHGKVIESIQKINIKKNERLLLCAQKWEQMIETLYDLNINSSCVLFWQNGIKTFDEIYTGLIHSQDGEELFLKEKFGQRRNGTYVDVGAFHPVRFSNTYWAYARGWRGINIEPNPDNISLFKFFRQEDINVNCGISNKAEIMPYYVFNEPALNTFERKHADKLVNETNYKLEKIIKVPVYPLKDILEQCRVDHIDFLDIYVEEHEMEVLQSIDFNTVDIQCIMVEQLGETLASVIESDIAVFLKEKGYSAVSKFNRTVIYDKLIVED